MNILKPALYLIFASTTTICCIAQNSVFENNKTQFENCVSFTGISNEIYEEIIKKADKSGISLNRRANYTIPVVFHIVHKNGSENIANEQVYDVLEILNEDFNKSNPDLVDVPKAFNHLTDKANVTFKLAKQAPDGNCSEGINRYFSGYEIDSLGQTNYWTDDGQTYLDEIKSTYFWDVDKYLNIYVVNNSENFGLSVFPLQVETYLNTKKWQDGIMILHNYLGNTGTASNNTLPHLLSHEVGHYFDLLHTWGNERYPGSSQLDFGIDCNNKIENCPNFYCRSDDLVKDTPNTNYRGSGCISENESCGTNDNITNIMAYGCQLMFTRGQVNRMHNALNSNIANRSNLWSDENLDYTLNCSGTPSTINCNQILSSFISNFKMIQSNYGVILGVIETIAFDTKKKIRYKTNNENWIELPVTEASYYEIDNIVKCAEYEFQISEKCGDVFSPWSKSRFFYTNGEYIPEVSTNKFYNIIEKQNETSFNANNGSITINPANGIFPYTYNWSTGATESTLNNLSAGEYFVTVTDFFGCSITDTVIINVDNCDSLIIDVLTTNQTYFNEDNGSISIEVENGIPPYNINWNTGDNLFQLNNLSPGEYIFSIEDSTGCAVTDTAFISPLICDSFLIAVDFEEESFVGANDATISLVAFKGISPLQYNWSTGDTTATINNLTSGDYIFTITDTLGCNTTDTLTIGTSYCDDLTVDILTTSLSNSNASDATALAIVSGGEPPYKFNWSTGDTLQQITNLQSDTYFLSLTDKNGCEAGNSATISAINCNGFSANILIENATCDNYENGSLQLTGFENAVEPVNYFWNKDSLLTENLLTGLSEGFYYFDAVDNVGCGFNAILRINNDREIFIETSILPESSEGSKDGSISATAAGGVEPYTYYWSTKESTNFINNLSAGTYTLTVTDANGCTTMVDYLLVEASSLCPEMSVITRNENLNSNIYQASNFIECNVIIKAGENITFRAADSISLKNGFEVYKGAEFSIEIGECE